MEFFINTLPLTISLCAAWWFYRKGYRDAKKKFQVEYETMKVSINKDKKEHCHFPDDGCVHDYKLKCKKCTLYY